MTVQPKVPVVTILGHVDHGKTTLLDFIRKTSVAAKEHGGITQAIGAYQMDHQGKKITFIDTPGHAAFEKMRYRGAQAADIGVLVVAVDDGVKPQTVEAIKHLHAVQIPQIVAISKIDLGADVKIQVEKIKKQLSGQKVMIEEYGGDVPLVLLSGKTGEGVGDLLDAIILLSEIHQWQADPNQPALGVVLESHRNKSKGVMATVLVRDGTLQKGDQIVAGGVKGKAKGMFDWVGKMIDEAPPSTPVEVLGFEDLPPVGSWLGKELVPQPEPPPEIRKAWMDKLSTSRERVLKVILKADKLGSLEVIESSLQKLNTDEHHLEIIFSGVGEIVEADVTLAATAGAVVLGFNVSVASTAAKLAEIDKVLIRTYQVVYELLAEMEEVVEGLLKPQVLEEVVGRGQVLAKFTTSQGEVAGVGMLEGVITKGGMVRIIKEGQMTGESRVRTLKKLKEEVSKTEKGQECGVLFDPPLNFQVGDIVESIKKV